MRCFSFCGDSFIIASDNPLAEGVRNLVARDDVAAALRFDGGLPLFNLLMTKGARGRGSVERLIDDERTLSFLSRSFGMSEDDLCEDIGVIRAQLIEIREAAEAIIGYQIFNRLEVRDQALIGVDVLNRITASGVSKRRLGVDLEGQIVVVTVSSPFEAKVAEVAAEVSEILLDGEKRARVKVCANEACRAPFMDRSPTNNRVWCSMAICGNRAKAKRYYHSLK